MNIVQTDLPGVLLIEPKVYCDARGFFMETWNRERYLAMGFPDVSFVQGNHSRSSRSVLRGLHFQLHHPQGKLVQVAKGAVFDVAVDIRVGSPTFGQWVGFELTDENFRQMWIPPGLAHGFCVLSETADFIYQCTDYYHPDDEGGILWNDPVLNIGWPVTSPVVAEKDQSLPMLSQMERSQLPVYRP